MHLSDICACICFERSFKGNGSHSMLCLDQAQYLQVYLHTHKISHNGHFILHHRACNSCAYKEGQYAHQGTDKKYQTSYSH